MKKCVLLQAIGLFFLGTLSFTTISCDKEEDRIDFYKSQNHSEELKGWWKRVTDEEHPSYIFFDAFILKTVSYSDVHGYYIPPDGDYWYNDATYIYKLSVGNFKSSGVENKTYYKLNAAKDTLRIDNNPSAYFVKSTQP